MICLLKTLSKLLYYNEISYLFSRLEKKADSDQPRPIISVLFEVHTCESIFHELIFSHKEMNLLSCSLKRLCKKHQSSEKVLKTRKNRLNFEVERKPTGFYCKMATNFGSITIDGMGKEFIQIQIFISNLGVTCIDVEHNSILKRIAHSLFFLRWNKIYFKVLQFKFLYFAIAVFDICTLHLSFIRPF